MSQNYPDKDGFALSFVSGELTMNGRIFTGISNVSIDQPTSEGSINGTKVKPIKRTKGKMEMGDGSVTFSDEEERLEFIESLGDGFRDKIWGLVWTLKNERTGKVYRNECDACRVLSNAVDHGEGEDALGGDIGFSFMDHKINGKRPHL